jgi:hypothetical protein
VVVRAKVPTAIEVEGVEDIEIAEDGTSIQLEGLLILA